MLLKKNLNISSLVDFERLRKSNDLCQKWAKRFKIKKNFYVGFITKLHKDPNSFLSKVSSRYKNQYIKDCNAMFYAAEVEELLLEQFAPMIIYVFKRLRVSYDLHDELTTWGYLAIRSAVWQFRSHESNASFQTFVFNSIYMRIKGVLHKMSKKTKSRKYKIYYESEIVKQNCEIEFLGMSKDYSKNLENISEQVKEIAKKCCLTEQETLLLMLFVNKRKDEPVWYGEYRKKYINEKTKKQLSRQSIHNHLKIVHDKVLNYFKQIKFVSEDYSPFQNKAV